MPTSVLRARLHQKRGMGSKLQTEAPDSQELPAQLLDPGRTHTASQKYKRLQTPRSVWQRWLSACLHSVGTEKQGMIVSLRLSYLSKER